MNRMTIDILNPKAVELLKNLADQNLISIKRSATSEFSDILKKLRKQSQTAPSLDEITKEVELVRAKR